MTKKYFHQTWDLVLITLCEWEEPDGYKILKKLNYSTRNEAERISKFLDNLFYGLHNEIDLRWKVEEGLLLNTLAIKANRKAMMDAQLIDIPEDQIPIRTKEDEAFERRQKYENLLLTIQLWKEETEYEAKKRGMTLEEYANLPEHDFDIEPIRI